MKKVVILVIFILAGIFCYAQTAQLEAFARVENKGVIVAPDANVYLALPFSRDTSSWVSQFKFTSFTLMEEHWGEQLFGIAWSPKSWIEIGLMAGVEQNPVLARMCASLWVGKGKDSFSFIYEQGEGDDNWWYRTAYKHQFGAWYVGAQSWRFQLTGPLVEYQLTKNLKIWVNPGRDLEFGRNALVAGVNLSFL